MSDYENRPVTEGINYSQENPLKEFLLLSLAAFGALVVLLFALSLAAQKLAPLIPFSLEARMAEQVVGRMPVNTDIKKSPDPKHAKVEAYLQSLADQLLQTRPVPKGLTLQVHYSSASTVNAFATLGGHIYMLDGLIEQMDSENALAMVLAHEIAHILNRDPIVAMGRGLTVSLALASLAGLANTGAVDWMMQQVGLATVMQFTRDQERAADAVALQMLQAHYGNVFGAKRIFTLLSAERAEPPEMFSTHPLSGERIAAIEEFAKRHPQNGSPQPLPSWLRESEEKAK